MKHKTLAVLLTAVLSASGFGAELLSPGDFVIAIDADGLVSNSSYPAGEAPLYVLDGDAGTKYLNFGRENSGFIVTPDAAVAVQSFTLTTANDAPARDPLGWELYGTNDAITSADNSTGLSESWTLLGSGTVTLPDTRMTVGPVVTVPNSTAYSSYKMLYPTLRDAGATNSMQVADVAFYNSTDGTGTGVLASTNPILAIQVGPDSVYPGAEGPGNAIDGMLNKYLNFGAANSGLIVTPSIGMTIVEGFQITTANDSPERDPAIWQLFGTNDPIASANNSDGTAENWTLIDEGELALPEERDTVGDLVAVDNDEYFASYKMLFTSLKDDELANSMQIAEIQFYGVPEPATMCLLGLGGLALLRRRS